MAIFTEVTENECVNDRHLRDNEYIQFGAHNDRSNQGLPLIFRPKLTHTAARSICDSRATC